MPVGGRSDGRERGEGGRVDGNGEREVGWMGTGSETERTSIPLLLTHPCSLVSMCLDPTPTSLPSLVTEIFTFSLVVTVTPTALVQTPRRVWGLGGGRFPRGTGSSPTTSSTPAGFLTGSGLRPFPRGPMGPVTHPTPPLVPAR